MTTGTTRTVNLEDQPMKSTIGFKEAVPKGFVFGSKYEVQERILNGTHFLYRCTCLKPVSDGVNKYTTVVLKVLSCECDSDANVLHELRLWNWIFSNRAKVHTQIQRLNRPLDSPGNDKRVLAFRPLHATFDQLREKWGPFTTEAVLRFGMEMFAAVRELHSFGVVHQNIQPGHFGVPLDFDPVRMFSRVVLLDFSQARPFLYYDSELPPAIQKVRTNPHPHFSSIEVMDGNLAQRRDDLMSWFYTMLCLRDKLTWEDVPFNRSGLIRARKADWHTKPVLLCAGFKGIASRRLCELHMIIDQLEATERPAYERMFDLLEKALRDFCAEGVHTFYTDYSVVQSYSKAIGPIRESITRKDHFEAYQTVDGSLDSLEYRRQYAEYRYDAAYVYDRAESRSNDALKKALEEAEDRRKQPTGTPASEKRR
ncbi:CK1 family protein kinase [Aphelenchoides besseyi]|nr:CK1 family protein kinase [Aphelenchoides besseyi]